MRAWLRRVLGGEALQLADPGVSAFRAEVAQATAGEPDAETIRLLMERSRRLDVPEEEVELELEMLQGAQDLFALRESVTLDGLPIVPNQHKVLQGETCHFAASASLLADEGERAGRVLFTRTRLIFVALPLLTVPWSRGMLVREDARDLIVHAPARAAVYRFRCNAFSDARCGRWLAERLVREADQRTTST